MLCTKRRRSACDASFLTWPTPPSSGSKLTAFHASRRSARPRTTFSQSKTQSPSSSWSAFPVRATPGPAPSSALERAGSPARCTTTRNWPPTKAFVVNSLPHKTRALRWSSPTFRCGRSETRASSLSSKGRWCSCARHSTRYWQSSIASRAGKATLALPPRNTCSGTAAHAPCNSRRTSRSLAASGRASMGFQRASSTSTKGTAHSTTPRRAFATSRIFSRSTFGPCALERVSRSSPCFTRISSATLSARSRIYLPSSNCTITDSHQTSLTRSCAR
mmetsp:Transcript_20702/g.58933  ORF Transcript_20702/g.58933 Transcript_20702/m.58933 type:complete len:276 (+) Transcript_20702:496-1323(+)